MDTGFAETKVEIVKWVLMSGERGCATLRYPQKIS